MYTSELISPFEKPLPEPYRLMIEIREEYHYDLLGLCIAMGWIDGIEPDANDKIVYAHCNRASEIKFDNQRTMKDCGWDYVIYINRDVWNVVNSEAKKALINHELCHIIESPNGDWETRPHNKEFHKKEEVCKLHKQLVLLQETLKRIKEVRSMEAVA